MGRVWLEAATLAHTERAVPLSKIHWDLEKNQPRLIRASRGLALAECQACSKAYCEERMSLPCAARGRAIAIGPRQSLMK